MIFFEEDWCHYPMAVIHYETTNRSALDLAAKLRLMGVKNNAFFLALLNPDLRHVDPYSPDLTAAQMKAIGIECKNNPWYVLRELARAPALSGTESKMVELNRANIALWWCFFTHITIILVQPRQTGKSFCTDWLMTCLMNFVCNNTQINLMTKDDKLRMENVSRLKKIYDELPAYVKFKTRDDTNNTEEISIKRFGNTYKTHVPQSSEKKAYNLGRGMTTPIFHVDEAPFQTHIKTALGTALMSMGAAIDDAKSKNEPYGVVFTTTAGKIDDVDGGFIYDMVEHSAVFSELFYDCKDEKHLEAMVRRHSPVKNKGEDGAFRTYASFSYQQLGKTDAWARDQMQRSTISGQDADRDLFNLWTSGSLTSPLPADVIAELNAGAQDPVIQTISAVGGYITRWYTPTQDAENYVRGRKVVLNLDTSDASGGDEIGLTWIDQITGDLLGIGSYNETNLIVFTQYLVTLFEQYPDMTMIIERRSSAITMLDYLFLQLEIKGIDPFRRIFNFVVNDPDENRTLFNEAERPMSRRDPEVFTRAKRLFGFATSGTGQTSRTELYSTVLMEAVKRNAKGVKDKALVSQLLSLVERNGRIDHAAGKRDDLVISWLLGNWFFTKAKNLKFYGIDIERTFEVKKIKPTLTQMEWLEQQRQLEIRNEIRTLTEQLQAETDPYRSDRLVNRLRALGNNLLLKEGEYFSIDAVMADLERKKREARMLESRLYQRNDYSLLRAR